MPPKQSNYKTPAPAQHSIQQTQKKKVAPVKTGRVNYTTLEDVPEGTQVMAGMFSIHHCPAIVLFDSGASHTFISQACVARLNLQVTHMIRPYIIHAPGAHLSTSQLVRGVPLDLSRKIFQTTPIVLPSQG